MMGGPLGESDVQWGWNMTDRDALDRVRAALQEGMGLVKCQKCGCMEETLEVLRSGLPAVEVPAARELVNLVEEWQRQLRPIQYACLGCEHCFPAVAMNVVREAFPEAYQDRALSCGFELKEQTWPAVPGEYSAFCDGPSCPVAVSTLASVELAEALAAARPRELCIVGKTETENIGIDKIVKNTIMNPTIRTLLVVGREPKGHRSGQTLLSLGANGVDKRMRVIGSLGKHPILRNVTREEVESFRRQVRIVDLIGREDTAQILDAITELGRKPDSAEPHVEEVSPQATSVTPVVLAQESPCRDGPGGLLRHPPAAGEGISPCRTLCLRQPSLAGHRGPRRQEHLLNHHQKWLGHAAGPRRVSRQGAHSGGALPPAGVQIRARRRLRQERAGTAHKPMVLRAWTARRLVN